MNTRRAFCLCLVTGLVAAVMYSVALSAQTTTIQAGRAILAPTAVAAGSAEVLGADAIPDLIVSPSAGAIASRVLSGANGVELASGFPFGPDFVGGVRMAAGDLSGDGIADLVAAMGPGGGLVTLVNGNTGAVLGSGYPFGAGFAGGVSVALGDVNGDGRNDIVAAPATGGGTVFAVDGVDYSLLFAVAPFGGGYEGGMNVATGDIDGDGRADIIVGQSNGGVAAIIGGAAQAVTASGAPFGNVNGVFVAAGDVNNDGRAEIIAAPGSGNGPVLIFDAFAQVLLAAAVPYPAGFTGGVRVAATDLTGDGRVEILTTPGPGLAPTLKVYDGATFANTANYAAYPASFTSGTLIAAPAAAGIRFTSAASANFRPGVAASFTVSASGTPPVTTITCTGALPAGVIFTNNGNGTATLAGTVPAGTANSTYPLTFTASSGQAASAQQSFTLSVGDGAVITSAASTAFSIGAAGSFTVTTTGTPTPTISRTGALPTGVTFVDNGNGTATIAGTAAAGTTGSYPLTLTASNGVGAAATQNFALSVQNGPVFTSASTATFTVGAAGTFTLTTSAAPPVTSISRFGTLPVGLSFTDNGHGTGTVAGTPAPGEARLAPYVIDFSAVNGVGFGTTSLSIYVWQTPVFTSAASATFSQGSAGTFTVTATGIPVPAFSLTGALPAGVSFTNNGNGTATFAGTPVIGTAGSYVVSINAANGTASTAVQSLTLNVAGAPAFTSAAATTFVAGTPGSFAIVASGGPTPAITVTGSLPAGVTLVDSGNGTATLAGTPGAGAGGNYPLTLTATNGVGAPATQNFVLTVNRAPAITSVNATAFTVNLASSFTVTTTGFPTPSVIVTGALPSGVTVASNPNGTATIAGTAAVGTNGVYALSVQATNGVGAPAAQNLSLTITNCTIVNLSPPPGSLPGGTFNTAYTQTFSATGGSGHTFAISAGSLPAGLTLAPSGGLTGSPSTTGTFNFTVTATASGTGCAGPSVYTLVVSPNAQNETYNNGVGNTQYSVGAGTPATPAVVVSGAVLTNDSGPGGLTAGPGSIASTNGGQVTMAATGTFLYTPPTGFAGGSDTFTYTLTDGNGATDTAVVTLNMSAVVWYVNAAAGAGDGRSQAPFNTMTAAATAAQVGHVIYVHSGSPAGATALKANQRLQGAGEDYGLNGLTIAGGTAPTLQGTVTLANGVVVRALNVNSGSATAVVASGLTGTEVLTGVAVTSGNNGLSLTNLGGTLSTSGGGISGVGAGGGVAISGGTGNVNIGSPVTGGAGRAVLVQNRTGGTVTFSGVVTDTSTGILLNANAGSTIAFTGGLALSTGANAAFTATNGGIVTATQNNTSIVNTLATSSGTALEVTSTQIGSSGLTFRSITAAAGGVAGAGIILDSTGTSGSNGGLTVSGTGTPGSGGTISGKAGPDGSLTQGVGIYLNNTRNVSLSGMALFSFSNSAIVGRNVFGFLMADSVIDGAGTTGGVFEGPVVFGKPGPGAVNGVQGTATFRNTTFAGGIEHNVAFYGQSGSLSLLIERTTANPADCKIEANSSTTGAQGVLVRFEGTASGSLTVDRCLLRGNRDAAVYATALDSSNLTVTVTGSDIGRSGQGDRGIVVTNGDDAALATTITNNTFFALTGPSVLVGQVPGDASALSILRATISNNVIDTVGSTTSNSILAALSSSVGAAARSRLLLEDNFIEHVGLQPAVLILAPDAGTSAAVDVTLTFNHIDMMEVSPGVNGALGLVMRNTQSATSNMCANITPNTSHWIPIGSGTGGGISTEQGGGAPFKLERGTQSLATPAATVLAANNGPYTAPGGMMLPGSTTNVSGTVTVAENGTCVLPSAP